MSDFSNHDPDPVRHTLDDNQFSILDIDSVDSIQVMSDSVDGLDDFDNQIHENTTNDIDELSDFGSDSNSNNAHNDIITDDINSTNTIQISPTQLYHHSLFPAYQSFTKNPSLSNSLGAISDSNSLECTDSVQQLTHSLAHSDSSTNLNQPSSSKNRNSYKSRNFQHKPTISNISEKLSINLNRFSGISAISHHSNRSSKSAKNKGKFLSFSDQLIIPNRIKSDNSINLDEQEEEEEEENSTGRFPHKFQNLQDRLRNRRISLKSKINKNKLWLNKANASNVPNKKQYDHLKSNYINSDDTIASSSIQSSQQSNTFDKANAASIDSFQDTQTTTTVPLSTRIFNFFNYRELPKQHEEDYVPIFSDSRYPEVRASVPNVDNVDIPQNTLRMWTIGLFLTTVGCALNTVFSLHTPLFVISSFVASMVAWPLGRLWERLVPDKKVFGIELNPGAFNLKEHALITIMASVSFGDGPSYMTDIVLTLRHFYNIDFGWGFNIIGAICTQAIGYSIAGIVRRILVYPASMIWPSTLVTTTFLTNIHLKVNHVTNGWHITRLKLFLIVVLGCFAWSWLTNFFAPFLSEFSFLTWIAPNNVIVNQLFGSRTGLGMLPITFNWNQVAGYAGSPLIPPFFAVGNIFASIVVVFWILTPIIHYSNVWYGKYLPISSVNTYDRFQQVYNVSRILTKTNVFDIEGYQNYSPLFLPTTFAVSYGMSFASISSTIVHTCLFHGKEIIFFWKHSRKDPDDIHMQLMKKYKEAPDWWYWLSLVIFLGMSIVLVRVWDTGMPVWALFFALAIAGIMLVPIGMIHALTNISVGLNVLTEFIVGYLVPGRPIAMMLFKTFGYITNYRAIRFLEGMKIGHYLKISPRSLFVAQLVATIWGGIVQLAALHWANENIVDICLPTQGASFTCSTGRVFFNASVIWGVIGPQRQLSPGQLYNKTLYFFLVGAMLPLLTWLFLKKYPKSPVRFIHWPVFFTGTGLIPPATAFSYGTYCAVGYVFGYIIKRRYFGWWAKYNYTLSVGLDLGLAWALLLIFIVTMSPTISVPKWWGTDVTQSNADSNGTPLIQLENNQPFGPTRW